MRKNLEIKVNDRNHKMSVKVAMELLNKLAERIYTDGRFSEELGPLLNDRFGCVTRGIQSRNEFIDLTSPRRGYLNIAFAGPSKTSSENLKRQEEAIKLIFKEMGEIIDITQGGATMYGLIKPLHLQTVDNRKISVGVMPWYGLWDLAKIASSIPDDFPKLNYLGIEGTYYGDHASLFGATPQRPEQGITILLGGRHGAFAEAEAGRLRNKPVICCDLDDNTKAISSFEKGVIILPSIERLVSCIKKNLLPDQRKFHGGAFGDFEIFDQYLRDNRIINIGFVSTSGAYTNIPYMRNVLTKFYAMAIPVERRKSVELTSGGTGYGGVDASYEAAEINSIVCNGLMCGQGLELPWSNCSKMFYVGDDWGNESNYLLYSSDIFLAYSGGNQAKEEIKKAAIMGGRYPTIKPGIPVICLYDEVAKGATWELFEEGYNHENIKYFHTKQLWKAAEYMKQLIK